MLAGEICHAVHEFLMIYNVISPIILPSIVLSASIAPFQNPALFIGHITNRTVKNISWHSLQMHLKTFITMKCNSLYAAKTLGNQ